MAIALITAFAGLIGIIVGGGVRAWEARSSRTHEAKAVLSALCSEVEAVNRLANHRQFLAAFQYYRAVNAALVAEGKGDEPGAWVVMDLRQNYFETFEKLTPKLGLIDPYFADRITRFYTYAKAVTENYRADSAFQRGVTAAQAVEAFDNDIMLLQTVHVLGVHISGFRTVTPPPGIIDPFPAIAAAEERARAEALSHVVEPAEPSLEGTPATPGG